MAILLCAVCLVACGGRQKSAQAQNAAPTLYGYRVVNTYPHDTEAYTQGLFRHGGQLYESTGEYGYSTLRRVDLATGAVEQKIDLASNYFAEGSAVVGDEIYLLTWNEKKCFVYDAATFEKTGEFDYTGEGWGLTTDGSKLYMSDGTANIFVRDPATFEIERTIQVRKEGALTENLNELEWIDGKIWANIYFKEEIVIIDPATGRVDGVIDFSGIERLIEITPVTDVMNGIACDPVTGRIWVTGKNWNKLFEIEIVKK